MNGTHSLPGLPGADGDQPNPPELPGTGATPGPAPASWRAVDPNNFAEVAAEVFALWAEDRTAAAEFLSLQRWRRLMKLQKAGAK